MKECDVYNIPLFKLNYDEDETEAVIEVLGSKWISMGEKTTLLENEFCRLTNSSYALAVTNCTAALHLALLAKDIGPGDEVIVPSLTFVATVNAVRYVGATPVFCDITSKHDLTISPGGIKKTITPKTKAVIVMHYAGFGCDMVRIKATCEEHNVSIIEDACHGPFATYNGDYLGTIGDIGCFSFFSNKNISTGEGGLMLFKEEEIFNKAKLLRSHGMTVLSYERSKGHSTDYDVVGLGFNYRMDDIRSSLALAQIKKISGDYEKRKKVRYQYIRQLSNTENITIPFVDRTDYVSNYIFPIIVSNGERDAVREYLQSKGIQTSVHYPAVHRFSIYASDYVRLPITEHVADNLITLPMYGDLSEKEIVYIVKSIREALANKG
jgi:dTDP-4-amino-4,6-dideoxygalactose transaminase